MKNEIVENVVKTHYDSDAKKEWDRFKYHPYEFRFTTFMMEKYVKENDTILDIGGGPGRYSIYFAKKGHKVTLVDLSSGNIALAKVKARQAKVKIQCYAKNCLDLKPLNLGLFDHVFLMGPLYHLLDEKERIDAVNIALSFLKPGGHIYLSFILMSGGLLYDLQNKGVIITDSDPNFKVGHDFLDSLTNGKSFMGQVFTYAYFSTPKDILSFMNNFNLEKVSFFGQESIVGANEDDILKRSKKERETWFNLGSQMLESSEYLCLSQHAMWIGKKK